LTRVSQPDVAFNQIRRRRVPPCCTFPEVVLRIVDSVVQRCASTQQIYHVQFQR